MQIGILFVLAGLLAVAHAYERSELEEWEQFKTTHGKSYGNESEEELRFKIFKENKKRIEKHNARFDRGQVSFMVGINRHADMLSHEVTERLNGYQRGLFSRRGRATFNSQSSDWPWQKSVDWRKQGYVTPVKDQGQCGGCWAFSTTGSLEGQLFKTTKSLVSLSEQNLIDCSTSYGNYGCSGGLMDLAFQYIKENGGIDTEESYPYTGLDANCSYTASNSAGTLSDFTDINPSERDLKEAVRQIGPISVAIDASNWSFQMYKSGVYYEENCSSEQLDHGVLAVGYGTQGWRKDYWIVKNSWGTSWGEEGYIRMARNRDNNCGIATEASFPTAV